MKEIYEKVTIVIPSYKPDEKLLGTIENVISQGFTDILVVDDGGKEAYAPIFEKVKQYPQCTVLCHPENRGKGAALKTAFAYFMENRPDSLGVVTADADGQHLAIDMETAAEAMVQNKAVVLGCRDFSEPHVPPRSKAGNTISRYLYRILLGIQISDTQTGLRAIPKEYIPALAMAEGDRYEYETYMLFMIAKERIPMCEVKIATVYLDNNSSSHFRVLHDSARIYARPLKYLGATFFSYILDILVFVLLYEYLEYDFSIYHLPFVALISGRLVSGLLHYFLCACKVFANRKPTLRSAGKYAVWSGIMLLITLLIGRGLLFIVPHSSACMLLYITIKTAVGLLGFFPGFRTLHNRVFHEKLR